MRIGTGSDIHSLTEGRDLVICGVTIPYCKGEEAHSDGDVLIHAIVDAILGAAALGDIGSIFPDSEEWTKGMDSSIMLQKAIEMTGSEIVNVDATVHLESPKLRPYILLIRERLSQIMGIPIERISVKAKSAEGLGAIGEGLAIAAVAAVLIE